MIELPVISLLVDLAVAIGTLGLAFLTVYQLRLLMRERKATQARELADHVYTPLRKEIASWTNPEEIYGGASFKTWTELKENAPYLTLRVPPDLSTTLDEAKQLISRVNFLKSQIGPMMYKETNRLGREFAVKVGISREDQTMLRIVDKHGLIANLDMGRVWSTRTSLRNWAKTYVATHYPVEDWEVQILVGPDPTGSTKEAEQLAEQLFEFLKGQPLARELLKKIEEVTTLSRHAIERIDQELSKPVAPWD
jgi:hypothetical protein